jgi:hypothetical protein
MKNNYLVIIVAIIVGLVGFYGGVKYQESKTPEFARNIPENFEQMRGQMEHSLNNSSELATVRGEIISKDDSSITVKLSDDSSKIVIFSDSTVINKSEEGLIEDLSEGVHVMVMGQTNSDGSVTARNIQIGTGMFREDAEHNE